MLSIIITNYKTPELLKLCIDSVRKSSKNINHEIFVIDSNSQEETQEMMREYFPETEFIPIERNIGYPRLVNMGLKRTKGKYILILNADIVTTEEAIPEIINFMEKNPQVGLLGPQLLNFNNTIQHSCFEFYTPKIIACRRTFLGRTPWGRKVVDKFLMKDWDHKNLKEVDWLMGSALCVRKETLKKVGQMDERFFMYFEDVDWARRFWENGYKVIYFPQVKMYHYHQRASNKGLGILDIIFNKHTRIHIMSAIKYFWKYRNKQNTKYKMQNAK